MEFFPNRLSADQSDQLAARIRRHLAERRFGFWAVEVQRGPGFIGFTGLSIPAFAAHFTPCVEIGWRLAFDQWGKGYATEAAFAALSHAFGPLGLSEVVAFTVPANLRSIGVMNRLGMARSASDDFDHPGLPAGHALQRHVLYRISKADWLAQATRRTSRSG